MHSVHSCEAFLLLGSDQESTLQRHDPNQGLDFFLQAEAQRLPRMSAAYGFMADPAGSALQAPPLGLRPMPTTHDRRSTLASRTTVPAAAPQVSISFTAGP